MRKPKSKWRSLAAACAVLTGLSLGSPSASAQGFLDLLFGGGPSYPQQSQRPPQPGLTTPGGKPYQFPSSAPSRGHDDDSRSITNYGSYKTICVRTCDGYYFPISSSTTRKGFARDEARCQASCGAGARLFHVPTNQSTVDDAVDGDGRAYVAMKSAFLYRKQKVEGCQCRNAPWSEAEQSRHRAYAEAEEAVKPRDQQAQSNKVAAANPAPAAAKSTAVEKATAADEAVTNAAAGSKPVEDNPIAEAEPAKRVTSKSGARSRIAADRDAPRPSQPYVKPPQGHGPVPVKLTAQAKAPPLGNPMGLGGGNLHWPGDAPPPQPQPRKR